MRRPLSSPTTATAQLAPVETAQKTEKPGKAGTEANRIDGTYLSVTSVKQDVFEIIAKTLHDKGFPSSAVSRSCSS
jgi:hypothetical protein